jgi:hypothetical protein
MSEPNWFARRLNFHMKCEKLEKLLVNRPTLFQEMERPIQIGPRPRRTPRSSDGETYENEIRYTVVSEGKIWVTVKLDNCGLYMDAEETREFTTEVEAQRCFQELIDLKHLSPDTLVEELQTFV